MKKKINPKTKSDLKKIFFKKANILLSCSQIHVSQLRIIGWHSILLLILIASIRPSLMAREFNQCEIGIDLDNTHLSKDQNNVYTLRSVIHHPNLGNDDDAWGVKVKIQLPLTADLIGDISVEITDTEGSYSLETENSHPIIDRFYTINIPHLARAEHADIKLRFSNPCVNQKSQKVMLSVWPSRPIDIAPCNNVWIKDISCHSGFTIYDYLFLRPDILRFDPIPIDEICKYVVDCPGCGPNVLCKGDVLRIPIHENVSGLILQYKDKVLAKASLDKSLKILQLTIPESIPKGQANQYTLVVK